MHTSNLRRVAHIAWCVVDAAISQYLVIAEGPRPADTGRTGQRQQLLRRISTVEHWAANQAAATSAGADIARPAVEVGAPKRRRTLRRFVAYRYTLAACLTDLRIVTT